MKKIFLFALAGLGLSFAACNKTDLQPLPGQQTGETVVVSVDLETAAPATSGQLAKSTSEAMNITFGELDTKSTYDITTAESNINDLLVIQYDNNTLVGASMQRLTKAAGQITQSGSSISFSVALTANANDQLLYFIANVPAGTITAANAATPAALAGVVLDLTVAANKVTPATGIPMLATVTTPVNSSAANNISGVKLERLTAKVKMSYRVAAPFSNQFKVTGVQLKNMAKNIYFTANPGTPGAVDFPASTTTSHADDVAETASQSATLTWYLPENLRKAIGAVSSLSERTLNKTDEKATYIEIKGEYTYPGGSGAKDQVTYTILLGDVNNGNNDFNVERNHNYALDITLNGYNKLDNRITVVENAPTVIATASNCFIVPIGSKLQFDATKRGNGTAYNAGTELAGTIPVASINKVELLWQDEPSLIVNVNGADKTKVIVETNSAAQATQGGNALVVARDVSNNILWSWHIWVTNYLATGTIPTTTTANTSYPVADGQVHTYGTNFIAKNPDKVIMDRNLGATKAYYTPVPAGESPEEAAKSFGFFYQWGRKDPFPRWDGNGNSDAGAKAKQLYDADNKPINMTAVAVDAAQGGNANTLGYSIANPLNFIYNASANYDWYVKTNGTQNNLLWGDAAEKTIFDPCPAGWRIAPNGTWNDFTVDGKNQSGNDEAYGAGLTYFPYFINGVQQTANGTPTFVQSARNGRYYAQGNVKVWYPAPGFRNNSTGGLTYVGNGGWNWSSTVNGTNVYFLDLRQTLIIPSNTYYRTSGDQVRCLRE